MAITLDGKKLYVALMGSEAEPGNEVAVFDVIERKVIKRIEVGSSPCYLGVHPAGRHIFVLNRFSNYASVIDTKLDKVVTEIPLDFYCNGMTYTRDGKRAYVSCRYLNQVFVLDVDAGDGHYEAQVRILGGFDDT